MMNVKQIFKKTALCFAVAGMMSSYSALAANALLSTTQLNISGKVIASACNVDTGSKDKPVDLGQNIESADLFDAGSYTEFVPFTLTLVDCPETTTAVIATFTGTKADENDALYKSTGSADFVQIDLQTDPAVSGVTKVLGSGATHEELVNHATKQAVFGLRARAYSTQGGVTPGTIEGAVQVGFTYR